MKNFTDVKETISKNLMLTNEETLFLMDEIADIEGFTTVNQYTKNGDQAQKMAYWLLNDGMTWGQIYKQFIKPMRELQYA